MDGEEPAKPRVPVDLSAPGLTYRLRRRGWVLSWSPRSDLTARGYPGKTVRLWPSDSVPPQQSEPTRTEWEIISVWCVRYHADQLRWARGGVRDDPKSLFDGTIGSLIEIYQKHRRSPFKSVRYASQQRYAGYLTALLVAVGKMRVSHITFEDVTDWLHRFADDGDGNRLGSRAVNLMGMLKRVVLFGAMMLPKSAGCHDLCDIFAKVSKAHPMKSDSRRREEYMTASQCRLIRLKAHEMDYPSVALEQAFAFELGIRQKDVIGEWIPAAWPGVSDVHEGPRKWLMGLRWEEIDTDLILRHRVSKSVRGKDGVTDLDAGKLKAWELKICPMVMEEFRRIASRDQFDRTDLPASGPLIVSETTDRPWARTAFKRVWREIARAAGLPDDLQNRDSRPGATTAVDAAGAPPETTQRPRGHSREEAAGIYLREPLEVH
jgi:hypothetical protein